MSNGTARPAERRKARRLAMQALYQWHVSKTDVGEIEAQFMADQDMKRVDRDYFHELLHQVPARLDELNDGLQAVLDRQVTALTPIELAILRMGLYELMYRIDVPYRVVINEGVEMAKAFGANEGHRYVNGVLDKLAQRHRAAETRSRG